MTFRSQNVSTQIIHTCTMCQCVGYISNRFVLASWPSSATKAAISSHLSCIISVPYKFWLRHLYKQFPSPSIGCSFRFNLLKMPLTLRHFKLSSPLNWINSPMLITCPLVFWTHIGANFASLAKNVFSSITGNIFASLAGKICPSPCGKYFCFPYGKCLCLSLAGNFLMEDFALTTVSLFCIY